MKTLLLPMIFLVGCGVPANFESTSVQDLHSKSLPDEKPKTLDQSSDSEENSMVRAPAKKPTADQNLENENISKKEDTSQTVAANAVPKEATPIPSDEPEFQKNSVAPFSGEFAFRSDEMDLQIQVINSDEIIVLETPQNDSTYLKKIIENGSSGSSNSADSRKDSDSTNAKSGGMNIGIGSGLFGAGTANSNGSENFNSAFAFGDKSSMSDRVRQFDAFFREQPTTKLTRMRTLQGRQNSDSLELSLHQMEVRTAKGVVLLEKKNIEDLRAEVTSSTCFLHSAKISPLEVCLGKKPGNCQIVISESKNCKTQTPLWTGFLEKPSK